MKKSEKPTFGSVLRRLRRSDPRDLTLADVADHIGIKVSSLSDIERGTRMPPSTFKLEKVLNFLNAPQLFVAMQVLAVEAKNCVVQIPTNSNPTQAAALVALAHRVELGDLNPVFWEQIMEMLSKDQGKTE